MDKPADELKKSKMLLDPVAGNGRDPAFLLQELRTHQLELELQNQELRQAQEDLTLSQRLYADLYDFAPLGYLSIDERGLITSINLNGAELLGPPRQRLISQAFSRYIEPEDQDEYYHCRKRLLALHEPQTCELRLKRKDGGKVDVLLKMAVNHEVDGRRGGFRIAITDISVGKALEAELRRKDQDLFQARKMEAVGLLAGGIAHDFNNILAIILAGSENLQFMLEDGSEPRVNETLAQITGTVQRASELVRQILTFSRKDMQTIAPLRPYPLVKESLKMLRATLPATTIIRDRLDCPEVEVKAAPGYIHQIVVNLCINAARSLKNEKGTLTLSTRHRFVDSAEIFDEPEIKEGWFLELSVVDDGCGIDGKIITHIFEPYFTTREVGQGSGLGLAVVHGIVKKCQGFIRVESRLGLGSTFRVYLPVVAGRSADVKAAEGRGPCPGGREKILLVDDESAIVAFLEKALERLGYQVAGVSDSHRALEMIRSDPFFFDLLLTDQSMPGLSGAELIRKTRVLRPDLPVIVFTGYSAVFPESDAQLMGVRKYLAKPVEIEELATAIRSVLDQNH